MIKVISFNVGYVETFKPASLLFTARIGFKTRIEAVKNLADGLLDFYTNSRQEDAAWCCGHGVSADTRSCPTCSEDMIAKRKISIGGFKDWLYDLPGLNFDQQGYMEQGMDWDFRNSLMDLIKAHIKPAEVLGIDNADKMIPLFASGKDRGKEVSEQLKIDRYIYRQREIDLGGKFNRQNYYAKINKTGIIE